MPVTALEPDLDRTSVTRTPVCRKTASAILLGALMFGAGACGNVPSAPATPTHGASVDPSVSPTPAASKYNTALVKVPASMSKDAVAKFGGDEVTKATDLIETIVDVYGFNDTLTLSKIGENKDLVLAAIKDMSPKAAQKWQVAVAGFTSGNPAKAEKAAPTVYSYALYAPNDGNAGKVNGKPIHASKNAPGLVNKQIRSVHAEVAHDERLVVKTVTSVDMRVLHGGVPKFLPFNRSTTYWMIKTDQGWKVDDWSSNMTVGHLRID